MRPAAPRATFCRRLRQAREAAGLSQKQLGIRAGLDEFVASTRINRYEVGVHEPDIRTARRLAEAMAIPLSYLYSEDDLLARMILAFARMPKRTQQAVLLKIEDDGASD